MRTDDIKKLIKAGYSIVCAQDYPNYSILQYNSNDNYWEFYASYPNKKERDKALEAMLQDEKTILD